MGMYTEFVFACLLKNDSPPEVIELLRQMVVTPGNMENLPLPDHPFFSCPRWKSIAVSSSYYFGFSESHSTFIQDPLAEKSEHHSGWMLSIRSSLKNYGGEIEKFVDWISPYIDDGSGLNKLLGYSMYEEAYTPTLYYLENNEREEFY